MRHSFLYFVGTHFRIFVRKLLIHLRTVYAFPQKLARPLNTSYFHLSRYSGVTAETLERVTTNRKDVQHKLRTMLQRDVILVGHSLEYDLRALKVNASWISLHHKWPYGPVYDPAQLNARK